MSAASLWPDFPNIVVDPQRYSGAVTIRGHRVSAHDIGQAAGVMARIDLCAGYGLTDAEVKEARAWFVKYGADTPRYPDVSDMSDSLYPEPRK